MAPFGSCYASPAWRRLRSGLGGARRENESRCLIHHILHPYNDFEHCVPKRETKTPILGPRMKLLQENLETDEPNLRIVQSPAVSLWQLNTRCIMMSSIWFFMQWDDADLQMYG